MWVQVPLSLNEDSEREKNKEGVRRGGGREDSGANGKNNNRGEGEDKKEMI